MVKWFGWDWSLVSMTNWLPSVLWDCWLGHLTCKMTYNVSSGTLSLKSVAIARGGQTMVMLMLTMYCTSRHQVRKATLLPWPWNRMPADFTRSRVTRRMSRPVVSRQPTRLRSRHRVLLQRSLLMTTITIQCLVFRCISIGARTRELASANTAVTTVTYGLP